MKLVVGLGNPGKKYEKTRHNVGFMVLDKLQERLNEHYKLSEWSLSKKFNAIVCGGVVGDYKVLLTKPMTFMNSSGQSVQLIGHFYRLVPEHVIVVHDDKDLPLGEVKVQKDRGHAGHNGVKSIMEYMGTKEFFRVRVGVASHDPEKMKNTAKFVLGKFSLLEKKQLKETINKSVDDIYTLLAS